MKEEQKAGRTGKDRETPGHHGELNRDRSTESDRWRGGDGREEPKRTRDSMGGGSDKGTGKKTERIQRRQGGGGGCHSESKKTKGWRRKSRSSLGQGASPRPVWPVSGVELASFPSTINRENLSTRRIWHRSAWQKHFLSHKNLYRGSPPLVHPTFITPLAKDIPQGRGPAAPRPPGCHQCPEPYILSHSTNESSSLGEARGPTLARAASRSL